MEAGIIKRIDLIKAKFGVDDEALAMTIGVSARTVEGWRQGRPMQGPAYKLLTLIEQGYLPIMEKA